jgi:putative phage-type endonuclease
MHNLITQQARQAERMTRLGSGDIAAVLGLDPYKTAFDVWLQKKGMAALQEQSEAALMGDLLEPVVAQRYAMVNEGVLLRTVPEPLIGDEPWATATPDRIVSNDTAQEWVLEIKTKSSWTFREFGEAGTDQVPAAILAQVMWQLGIAGMDYADIAVLVDGRRYAQYGVNYDRQIFSSMMEQARQWWERHVVRGEEPKLEGSAVVPYLREKFKDVQGDAVIATEDDDQMLALYGNIQRQVKELEERKDRLQTRLMERIGHAPGLLGEAGGKVSWLPQKGRTTVDYKALVADLGLSPELIQQYTRTGQPIRVFRYSAPKTNGVPSDE